MPLETLLQIVSDKIHEEDATTGKKRKRGGTKDKLLSMLFDRMSENITADEKKFLKTLKKDLF